MRDDGEHIERIFHIEALKGELEELAGAECVIDGSEHLTPEVEEQFLEQVLAFERAPQVTHRSQLERAGVALPPADELSDEELGLKLIEVIHALAVRQTYLLSTDHLGDRALYTLLVEDVLNEWTPDLPPVAGMSCHLDLVSSGSEEDTAAWLRYYADEDQRQRWARDWPDETIPPHEDPPYDRDRHLPRAPELS